MAKPRLFCVLQCCVPFGSEHHAMTTPQRTTGRIGNQVHARERPKNPAAARASYFELQTVVGPENLATGDEPQGLKILFS
jgi:hypothetical protein